MFNESDDEELEGNLINKSNLNDENPQIYGIYDACTENTIF
jgi:hypothetical protein